MTFDIHAQTRVFHKSHSKLIGLHQEGRKLMQPATQL